MIGLYSDRLPKNTPKFYRDLFVDIAEKGVTSVLVERPFCDKYFRKLFKFVGSPSLMRAVGKIGYQHNFDDCGAVESTLITCGDNYCDDGKIYSYGMDITDFESCQDRFPMHLLEPGQFFFVPKGDATYGSLRDFAKRLSNGYFAGTAYITVEKVSGGFNVLRMR